MPAPSPRSTRIALAQWRGRFKHAVAEKFLVRFHMALMLAVVTLVGMIANGALARLGVERLAWRYPLAVLASYLAFFCVVRLWTSWVHSEAPPPLKEPALAAALISASALGQPRPHHGGADASHVADLADAALDAADGLDGVEGGLSAVGDASGADEGVVVVLALLLLLAVFAAGAWLVWQAPIILSEAAFSAVLAGAMRRASRSADGPSWAWSLFKRTVFAFSVVALFSSLAGFGAQAVCPEARTLRAALTCEPRS